MCVLNLLVFLLVATRPTRSVAIEPGIDLHEPVGSGQANAATRIASSTFSDPMSLSQEWAMLHDETQDTHDLHFPLYEYSTLESHWLHGDYMVDCDIYNINGVDRISDSYSMNESSSKIDTSHINIDSQQLSREGENLDFIIDPILIDSEMLPSEDSLDYLVPDNRNSHQFGDSSFKYFADCNPITSSNRDVSPISIDGQQSIESVDGENFDCRIGNTINSKTKAVDVRENFAPDGFPEHTQEMVRFPNAKYVVGFRMLFRVLNWDLDEVKDYDSLCEFLGKETNPEQVECDDSVAITENMMELLFRSKSGRNTVEVGQNNIDVPQPRLIAQATSTMQKLIRISNFVLKLVISCRRSLCSISPKLSECLKRICIPVLQCLVKCCGKDLDLFQTRWGNLFAHRNFGVKFCPGRGLNHITCGFHRTKIVKNPDNRDKNYGLLNLKALVVAVQMSRTSEDKLNLCCEFNEKYQLSGANARRRLQSYYSRSQKPIWGCFVHHCGQDINEWIRKWGTVFAHAEFGRRKCHGLKSHRCGSINPPFDIPSRLKLPYKSTRDLLPALSKILEEYDQFLILKTVSMRPPHSGLTHLINKCLRPIYNCLHRHCAGSVEEFVRRWGESVSYTKFRRNYCPGADRKESDVCPYNSRSSQD